MPLIVVWSNKEFIVFSSAKVEAGGFEFEKTDHAGFSVPEKGQRGQTTIKICKIFFTARMGDAREKLSCSIDFCHKKDTAR
jgi:hypothetical protein